MKIFKLEPIVIQTLIYLLLVMRLFYIFKGDN